MEEGGGGHGGRERGTGRRGAVKRGGREGRKGSQGGSGGKCYGSSRNHRSTATITEAVLEYFCSLWHDQMLPPTDWNVGAGRDGGGKGVVAVAAIAVVDGHWSRRGGGGGGHGGLAMVMNEWWCNDVLAIVEAQWSGCEGIMEEEGYSSGRGATVVVV
ncbi:hypothetical protein Acr_23g0010130 [Actinidia rufa]|uniref:Uncharacterized protein n=1 Tax=Actinidia rufa TaxID=165716 RepID=A0A7J0GPF6_9ERIC|nr:hypothetical protein Acr_23g0010130 [Actinidia rufa]